MLGSAIGPILPWMLVPRSSFLYHFLPAVPFGCLAVAILMAEGWRQGGAWRVASVGYVLAVAAAFVFFYPVLSGLPLTLGEYDQRMWLGSWR